MRLLIFGLVVMLGLSVQAMDDVAHVTEISNHVRLGQGLESMSRDEALENIAQAFAEDMEARGYFSHRSPEGGTLGMRLHTGGASYRTAGENIARGQPDAVAVMKAWMNSPGHRANILNERYRRIGIGRAGAHWVMVLTD